MFGFGLFSTHIPYLILIGGYVLYFTVTAAGNLLTKESSYKIEDSDQKNEIILSGDNLRDGTTFFYEDDHDDLYVAPAHDSPPGHAFLLILIRQQKRIPLSQHKGPFYTRPPPFSC